jgi:hypothetical protein
VEHPELCARIESILELYWADNVKAREQGSEPTYHRRPVDGERVDAQATFLEQGRKRRKPDVDVKPVVVKTNKSPVKTKEPSVVKVGQPA